MSQAPTPGELEAARFVVTDSAFKAGGQVCAFMLAALKEQHPSRAEALNVAIGQGMHLALQLRFGPDSKAVLQMIDDYGNATELAAVPVVIRDPNDTRTN